MKVKNRIVNFYLTFLFLLLLKSFSFGQKCETYNRKLFHMLPETFSTEINCIDSLGRKQGLWIIYKIEYNPIDKPDELEKGDYVDAYSFGSFKDDFKIGEWKTINNVHMIYVNAIDNYNYYHDTIIIKSDFAKWGWKKSILCLNRDSSYFKYEIIEDSEKFPLCIECKKNQKQNKQCTLKYREQLLKYFPFKNIPIEMEKTIYDYTPEKKRVDQKLERKIR